MHSTFFFNIFVTYYILYMSILILLVPAQFIQSKSWLSNISLHYQGHTLWDFQNQGLPQRLLKKLLALHFHLILDLRNKVPICSISGVISPLRSCSIACAKVTEGGSAAVLKVEGSATSAWPTMPCTNGLCGLHRLTHRDNYFIWVLVLLYASLLYTRQNIAFLIGQWWMHK